MSNPVIIETDLKDILDRIDKRLDRIEQKFETRIDRMEQKFETRLDGMEQKFETRLDGIDQKLEILPRIEAEISQINGPAASYGVLKFNFFDFSYAPRGGELTRD
jgi:tetrahydromethanopterin S-methyltransferase subunit G